MKKCSQKSGLFRPFKDLKTLLDNRSVSLRSESDRLTAENQVSENNLDRDKQMFEAAMADVERLPHNICIDIETQEFVVSAADKTDDAEVLVHLDELIRSGKGFVVADTAEYVEGTGYNVSRTVAKRLHNGDFAIQGHIDLHGQSVESARTLFDQFFKDSIANGKRMILVIHGRGLSSPAEPVLKTKVIQWLSSGPWRKWVMAYTSARLCDGGAGATYVLLRRRPATRRSKRKKRW